MVHTSRAFISLILFVLLGAFQQTGYALAPVATDDNVTTTKNSPLVIDVLTNDTADAGVGLAPNTLRINRPYRRGIHALRSGQAKYSPLTDFIGTESFKYTVRDTTGLISNQATVNVTVRPPNVAPGFVKGPDQTVNEDAATQIVNPWATSIDDGDPGYTQILNFNVTGNTNPGLFSAGPTISPAGDLTYTPAPDTNGSATISLTLHDDGGVLSGGVDTSATQTFGINVTAVNDVPGLTAINPPSVVEDAGPQSVTAWAVFNPGNSRENTQTVLAYSVTNISNAALFSVPPSVDTNGKLTYTAAPDANGSSTFDVTVQDDGGTANGGVDTSSALTFTITVTPVNDPPIAVNDAANVDEGGTVTVLSLPVAATSVLANDSDTDLDPLVVTITPVSGPSHGSLTLNFTGTFSYTHDSTETTGDSFSYEVCDTGVPALCSNATVAITINPLNDPPALDLDSVASGINFATAYTEGDPAVGLNNGIAITEPDDTHLESALVTLSNAQDAAAEQLSINSGLATGFGITATVAPDGHSITLTGAATLDQYRQVLETVKYHNSSNNPTVSPDRAITFKVNDGNIDSAVATASVTVNGINSAPVFTISGNPPGINEDAGAQTVNAWATSIGDGDANTQTLTFNVTNNNNALFSTQPAINASGVLSYTPAANANGTATVSVTLSDDGSNTSPNVNVSAAQTFIITVNAANDAPTFTAVNPPAVNEDAGAQSVPAWATFNPGPANESAETVVNYTVSNLSNAALFSVQPTVDASGNLSYTPAVNVNGTSSFDMTVQDSGGTANSGVDTSSIQTFSITVTAADDSPTTVIDSATVNEDSGANTIDVLTNDTDIDGGPKSVGSVTQPANGTVAITNSGADLSYTPNANYCNNPPGTTLDTFTYTLTPGGSTSTVTITVTCVNDPPTAVDDAADVNEGGTVTVLTVPSSETSVLSNDSDPDAGNILSVTTVPAPVPAHGSLTLNANGTFSYTHDGTETAGDSFTYEVCDNAPAPLCDTATVNITINPVNDAPVIAMPGSLVTYDPAAATPVVLDATATVTDIDSPDFNTGVLSANVTTNCENNDRLGVRDQGAGVGNISISGATVLYDFGAGPAAIGTIATEFDCSTLAVPTLTVTLNAAATPAATQALLRNVTYFSNSPTPTGTTRSMDVVLTDGDGGTSNTAGKTVNLDAPPKVNTIVPANNATNIAITDDVVITFSEAVNVSGNWFQIVCPTSGTRNVIDTVVGGGPTIYTINPNADFANGEICTVTVTAAQVTDQDAIDPPDTMATDFTSSFTTVDAAPSVTTVTPAAAAVVATTQTITVNFSENVNLSASAFTLNCPGSVAFTSLPALPATATNTVTLTPTGGLSAGASCALTVVAAQVSDSDSVDPPDLMASDFTRSFTVDAEPAFSSSTPTDGATDVVVSNNIVLNFSEAVAADTNSFTIDCGGSQAYAVTGSGSSGITLNPTADLPGATNCTVTINGGNVSDSDIIDPPNTMTTSPSFSFTTQPIAVDDAYNVTPHLTLNVDTGIQSGRVTANDQLGVGAITGFGFSPACSGTAPGSQLDAGASNGRLTLNLNGSFSYEPPAGVVNTTKTFCYTVTGGDTANIVFTLQNTELVWFVDAAAGAGGTGNQARPLQTLAAVVAAPHTTNDTIFVKDNASAYTCGITLLANEKLIGEGSGSDLDTLSGVGTPVSGSTFPGLTTDSAFWPTLTAAANCVTLGSGNTIRGFAFGNVGAANTVLSGTNFGTLTVNDTSITTNGRGMNLDTGTLAATFSSVSSNGSSNEGVRLNAVGGSMTTGSTSLSNSTLDGIRALSLTGNWDFGSVTVNTTAQTGMYFINGSPTIHAGNTSISNTSTSGLALQGLAAGSSVTIDNVTISNTTTGEGVLLFNNNSTVNINGGSIQNAGSADFRIDGGLGNVTYLGTITDDVGTLVNVANTTGGTKLFSGAISDGNDGDGSGITLSGNTGATINFSGGLTLSTGANPAFTATGGGTVNVTGTNTLVTTTGTALNVANTTIGASGLTFQSIAANGGANGIVLNTTGAGGLTVTGTGTTDGTGGTIQNITTRGASFISASNITLKNMNFTNAATVDGDADNSGLTTGDNLLSNAPIHLQNVTNATLDNLNITTSAEQGINGHNVNGFTLSNSVLSGLGNEPDEDGLHFYNMVGTCAITDTSITSSGDDNVNIQNNTTPILPPTSIGTITVTGGSFNTGVGGSALLFGIRGTSNTTINISGVTLDNNFSGGVVADSYDTATMKLDVTGITDINNNDGIQVSGHNGSAQFDIHDNSDASASSGLGIYNNDFLGVFMLKSAFSSAGRLEGQITNTEVTIPDQRPADAIFMFGAGGSDFRTAITSNSVDYRGTQRPITVSGGQDGAALMDSTITGNDIDVQLDGTNNALGGFLAQVIIATPSGNGSTLCADIGGAGALSNLFTHSLGGTLAAGDIRVRQRNGGPVRLPGYSGGNNDNTAVITYLDGRNGEVSTSTATNDDGLFSGGTACAAPVIP